ncbi:MAG: DUF4097 family beta strand repeat-containing protein [Gemmatimonadales bacterium]
MRLTSITALAVLAAAAPTPAFSQQDFSWRGRIPAGGRIEIKGVNGDVSAVAASGAEAEVTAIKRGNKSDPDDVTIEVIEHAQGVTICAVYPTPPRARQENGCDVGDDWHSNTRDNDVNVHFTVKVPRGVAFHGRTVNGEMDAVGLSGDAFVSTVNGSVRVSTTGLAEATTVNGSITASLGRANWQDELEFHTVNGGITLDLPGDLDTEVRAETVNGDIISDFPLTVRGRFGPRRVSGTIGKGGRTLHLGTVNGNIKLRKRA